jgi:3-hydroxyisobutyrate dehydrogenase
MKALNNYVGAAAYTSAAEALAIGQRFGLTPATMIEVINASTGRSFNSEVVFKEHVVSGRYATGFALGLLAKDVGIAADLAETAAVEAPVCQLVSRRWSEALAELGPAADHSEAHKRWWSSKFVDVGGNGAVPPG